MTIANTLYRLGIPRHQADDGGGSDSLYTTNELEENVLKSLRPLARQLNLHISSLEIDDAVAGDMIKIGAAGGERFERPYTPHDIQFLACTAWQEMSGEVLTYFEIQDLTLKHAGKAMSTPMIYRTAERLRGKGHIQQHHTYRNNGGSPVSCFTITDSGRSLFRYAVLSALEDVGSAAA